jgi:hypothetical protein
MIRRRVVAWLTVGRLEYLVLLVGGLICLAAKRAGVNDWVLSAAWLLMALAVRRARNRGMLDRFIARQPSSSNPSQET